MARKRMFRLDVLETDAFMDMPLTAQALYFHLNMRADDDGFIGNPNQIVRSIGASADDLKLLIAKRFVLAFEDGVIVIKHWRLHNTLSQNRYHETNFIDDKAMLRIKDNKAYTFNNAYTPLCDDHLIEMSKRQTIDEQKTNIDGQKTDADKNSIEKKRKEKTIKAFIPPSLDDVKEYAQKRGNKVDAQKFFDYYTAGNWKDAKGNPVKNWKQKMITWESRQQQPTVNTKIHNFSEREYDYDELAKIAGVKK